MKKITYWRMIGIYTFGIQETKLQTEDRDKALEKYKEYKEAASHFNFAGIRGAVLERVEEFIEEEVYLNPVPMTEEDRIKYGIKQKEGKK